MRHLRSILYALVLAPAAWVLCAVGFTRELTGRARDGGSVETFTGLLLLLLAGAAYALLLFAPISPLGPALAGLAFLGVSAWAIASPSSYGGAWPDGVAEEGFDLSLPGYGLAALLAVPLLCTASSGRRWAGHRAAVPLVGVVGRSRGAAAVPGGEPVAATRTAVVTTSDPTGAITAARQSPRYVAAPGARNASADNGDEPTVMVTSASPGGQADDPTVATRPATDEPTVVTATDDEPAVVALDADEPTVVTPRADEPTVVAPADDEPTMTVVSDDRPAGTSRSTDDEPTGAVGPVADGATEPAPPSAVEEAAGASPGVQEDEATVPMATTAAVEGETTAAIAGDRNGQHTPTDADEVTEVLDRNAADDTVTTEVVAGTTHDETDVAHGVTDVVAATDHDEPDADAAHDETAELVSSHDEEPTDEVPAATVAPPRPASAAAEHDDHDRTQLIRLPGGDAPRYGPGEITQVIPRGSVHQPDQHDEQTQVIRLPAAVRERDIDGDRTQVIGYHTGTVEPPGDQTQVLRIPLPAPRPPQDMDEPDTRPQSILGEERPDPSADPTTRLVPPQRHSTDDLPQTRTDELPRKRPSFKDMERPADEVADDTRRLAPPPPPPTARRS